MSPQLLITVADAEFALERGDAYTFPASTEHSFRAGDGPGPARVLWVFSPAIPDTVAGHALGRQAVMTSGRVAPARAIARYAREWRPGGVVSRSPG
jgi:Cupin domain